MTFAFFALFLNLMKTSESSRQMKKKTQQEKEQKCTCAIRLPYKRLPTFN